VDILDRNVFPVRRDLEHIEIGMAAAGGEPASAAPATAAGFFAQQELRHRQRGGELPNLRRPDDQVGVCSVLLLKAATEQLNHPAVAEQVREWRLRRRRHARILPAPDWSRRRHARRIKGRCDPIHEICEELWHPAMAGCHNVREM